MGTLSSVYEYQQHLGVTLTSAQQTQIEGLLVYATQAIQNVCKHNLENQSYLQWYKTDIGVDSEYNNSTWGYNTDYYITGNRPQFSEVYGANVIVLNQWPITSISVLKANEIGYITADSNSITVANLTTSATGMLLNWYDTTGTLHSNTTSYTLSKTISAVKSSVEANSGWSFNIYSGYENIPSSNIKQCYTSLDKNNSPVQAAVPYALQFTIENDRKLIFNDYVDNALLSYSAGYTYPIDNAGHTALVTAGNVPQELKLACIYVASDLLSFINGSGLGDGGVALNLVKSENLGDYSYQKFDNSTLSEIAIKYQSLYDTYVLHAI